MGFAPAELGRSGSGDTNGTHDLLSRNSSKIIGTKFFRVPYEIYVTHTYENTQGDIEQKHHGYPCTRFYHVFSGVSLFHVVFMEIHLSDMIFH